MREAAEKTLKIVMAVANNSYPGDTRVRNEAQTLASAGFDLTVISPRGEKQTGHEIVNGVRVIRYPAPPNGQGRVSYAVEFIYVTIATSLAVLYVWMKYGLDVLHIHNPPDTLFYCRSHPEALWQKTGIRPSRPRA